MEVTAEEMKNTIRKIYDELDKVSPVDFDCGKLCGEVCCVYDEEDYRNEDLALYLIPGEELMYEDSDSFELYCLNPKEVKYPYSWKDSVYLVKCKNPPKCDRDIRPIQCRTFPLIPHITKKGDFHLIFDESEFPYKCPIIHDDIRLNDDFITVTYNIWCILITNPLVYDLVAMDSRLRDNRKVDYQIVL